MTILAVFRSRSQTIDFVSRLQHAGILVQTVNTPKEAGVGCGLSAKFDDRDFLRARGILNGGNGSGNYSSYSSFAGFFHWQRKGDKMVVTKMQNR